MPLFEWKDVYLVGIPEFDAHHQHLVALLNKSYEAYENNTPHRELEILLDELVDYASYHFAAEENWMTQNGYPRVVAHKKEHAEFAQKVHKFQKDFVAVTTFINQELFIFLSDWLVNHILECDGAYSRFNAALRHSQ